MSCLLQKSDRQKGIQGWERKEVGADRASHCGAEWPQEETQRWHISSRHSQAAQKSPCSWHALRPGRRLPGPHLHLAVQQALCCSAAAPQKGLAHHPCPLLSTGQRGNRQGLQSRGWGGTDGGHRGDPESPRGFWVTISTSSFHSCKGASLHPTPLGDGDACPHLL